MGNHFNASLKQVIDSLQELQKVNSYFLAVPYRPDLI